MSGLKKVLLIIAGSISLALGVAGVVLPLLPTTPFLLLSAFCYLRSSQRLYDWLMNRRVFGPHLYDYVTYRAVRFRVKAGALAFLWLTLTVSMVIVSNIYARVSLCCVGVAVSIHILCLKTLKGQEGADGNVDDGICR